MANIEKITLPDNTTYDIKDANALPKSAGSSNPITGDLYMASGTQRIGGHPIISHSTADSITCPADTGTAIESLTGLDSDGIYLVTGYTTYTPSATGIQYRLSLVGGTYPYTVSAHSTGSGTSHYVTITGIMTGTTSVVFNCKPNHGSANCTCSGRIITAVRLA